MPGKISVIIPTYNCGRYLDQSIESVLAQSYAHFEIIVVDDGSTDNTSEVLSKYRNDARIKSVYQSNKGPGAARNTGIHLSEGEYVCFLDSDDVMEPESLRSRYEVLSTDANIAMVFTDYTLRHDEKDFIRRYLHHNGFLHYFKSALVPSPPGCTMFNGKFIELFYSFSPHPVWTGTVMLKKSVVDSVGLFRTDITVGEDTDYWVRIAEGHKFAYIDKPTAEYNHYRSGITKDTQKYCKERIRRLKSIPLASRTISKTICRNISDTYCHLGYYYYQHNVRILSAYYYMLGLRYKVNNTLCIKGMLSTLMPQCFIKNIKSLLTSIR